MATRRRLAVHDALDLVDPHEAAGNALRGVLEDRGQARVERVARKLTLRGYAALVPEPRGPLDLARFPWQEELLDERSASDREQVYMKATQVGVSTLSIRQAFYFADVQQWSVLYTFPTDDDLKEFSRKRIRPAMRASDHLMSRVRGDAVDNVGQKQIGADGWIIFRGTQKPIDSLDIDVAIFDEYDESDQANIEASERRVTGPQSAGLIRRIGVPSVPGFGIAQLFEDSDQRVWTVRCRRCGERNPMRGFEAFEANVDQDRTLLVCRAPRCRGELDVRDGSWVAQRPERDVRGYHVPKLLVPGRRTLATLVANSRKTKDYQRTAFHTRDLGEAYAPREGRLSRDQLEACVRPELRPVDPLAPPATHRPRFMGIDMASVRDLNVIVDEELDELHVVRLWAGLVEDDPSRGSAFAQVCAMIDRLGVAMVGIDQEPEGRFGIALAARYPGRVYRVGFYTPGGNQRKAPEPWRVDDEQRFVSLWRARAYDASFERYRLQQVLLPPLDLLPTDLPAQLGNLVRQRVEQRDGSIRVDYVKTGPEDYAQADAYCLCAQQLFWRNAGRSAVLGAPPRPAAGDPYEAPPEAAGYRPGLD